MLLALALLGSVIGARHWLHRNAPPAPAPVAVSLPPVAEIAPAAGPSTPSPALTPEAPPAPSGAPGPAPEAMPHPAGEPAWERFAAIVPPVRDQPMVAIVIDDLGLDRVRTERAITLPAGVTLSFLSYAEGLPALAAAARARGHELIVHVPMEPVDTHMDMGPNGLSTRLPREEVLRRLDWDLGRFEGYVGINNHMGSRFTEDAVGMGWVMEALKARGLLFLDSRTIAASVAAASAAASGVPFAARDVFLDDDQHAPAVQQQLRAVEAVARKHGSAIAIGHPHDVTQQALAAWLAGLPEKGIVLVPLTAVVKARLKLG